MSFLKRYPVRTQFFLCYGFIGCLLPYVVIYLQRVVGMSDQEIGWMLAFSSLSIMLSPVILTALADSSISGRRLIGGIFCGSSVAMLILAIYASPLAAFLCFGFHMFLFISMLPLQDGLHFSVQQKREIAGQKTTPYHNVRVWGTIGFIIPSLILYGLLEWGIGLSVILYAAVLIGLLGILNSFFLPEFPPQAKQPAKQGERLPSIDAFRVLLRPRVALFCLAMLFAHLASTAYFGFYPLYLVREVGVTESQAGLIFNLGVVVEILFILGFGWAHRVFGLRRLLIVAAALTAFRMALLAAFPSVTMALVGQVFHGMIVITLQIGPVIYLNSLAGDRFRNSIQGVYTVLIAGLSRVVGHLFAGQIAAQSLLLLYAFGSVAFLVCTLLLLFFFRANDELSDKRTMVR